MIKVFLAVSVACNVWFLFMLLSDRIMETKFVRFLKGCLLYTSDAADE